VIPIMVKVQVEVAHHGNVLLRSSASVRLERVHAEIDIRFFVGVFESQPGLESRLGQLLGCNEALNNLVFLAALDHDRQPVRGFEVILYVFPRGDGPFCMTLVSHLVSPAVLSAFAITVMRPGTLVSHLRRSVINGHTQSRPHGRTYSLSAIQASTARPELRTPVLRAAPLPR